MTVRIYLDANVFIFAFERTGHLADNARAVLDVIRNGEATGVISELVVAELLVKPLSVGDTELGDAYAQLFEPLEGYESCPVDRNVLIEAARQRARRNSIRLPDAVHIATALLRHCSAFVSHDRKLDLPHDLIAISLDSALVDIRSLA